MGASAAAVRTRVLSLLPACAAAALCAVVVLSYARGLAYCNDLWFLLDIGKDVLEYGVPRSADSYSVFPDCDTVAQQWLYSAVLYAAFKAFGFQGVYLLCAVILLLVLLLAGLLVSRMLPRGSFGWSSSLAFVLYASMLAASTSMRVRPSLVSSAIWLGVALLALAALERGDGRVLLGFPLLCALHVNLHASMAPFDFAVLGALLLCPTACCGSDGRFALRFSGRGRRVRWFVSASVAGAVALLANPYGWKGALYFFLSYGVASSGDVGELYSVFEYADLLGSDSPVVLAIFIPGLVLLLSAAVWVLGRGGASPSLPLGPLLLAAVSAAAACAHVRCGNLLCLFGLVVAPVMLASSPKDSAVKAARGLAPHRVVVRTVVSDAVLCFCGLVVCLRLAALGAVAAPGLGNRPVELDDEAISPASAVALVLEEGGALGGFEGNSGPTVFADGDSAGLFELAGCRVQMDARPELFAPCFTGAGEDYSELWNRFCVACRSGDAAAALEVVERCACDYVMVTEVNCIRCPGLPASLAASGSYELVLTVPTPDGSPYCTGYTFWKKVR